MLTQPQDTVSYDRPPFPLGGPTGAAWREHALARIAEQRIVFGSFKSEQARDAEPILEAQWKEAAETAKEASLLRRGGLKGWVTGSAVDRVTSQLDAVEGALLRVASDAYVVGEMPNLIAHVKKHLPPDDHRRLAILEVADRKEADLSPGERETIISAVRVASGEARREVSRLRSFRNIILVTALLLTLGAGGIAALGLATPERLPLCFQPGGAIVCPTATSPIGDGQVDQAAIDPWVADEEMRLAARRWDILVVELVGLIAAAVSGAFALRTMQGTSAPYSLPVALAVLKLPTGALTAVLGLLLMRGEFVPGLSALDSSAQIISWAIIFGFSQHAITHLVDRQAQVLLDNLGQTIEARPDSEPSYAAPRAAAG